MANLNDADELWRQIPPEEKLTLLNRSHGSGVFAACGVIIIGAACAVGLQHVWLFWGAFLVAPLVFQFGAGRTWRTLKPALMLEFLAAKAAARRFAFTAHAKDLTLQLLFRGTMEDVVAPESIEAQAESAVQGVRETAVWIALFRDAVVLMEEQPGGAQAQFAQPISSKLEMEVENSGEGDYSPGKVVTLGYSHKLLGTRKVRISSEYPAAMVVFEKSLARRLNEAQALDLQAKQLDATITPDSGSDEESQESDY